MARRRIEMFHYRQALVRMRQGDYDYQIAADRIMCRRTTILELVRSAADPHFLGNRSFDLMVKSPKMGIY